jgi:hypothetical protein
MCAVPVTWTVSRRVFAIDMISIPPVPVVIATAIATEATLIVAAWGVGLAHQRRKLSAALDNVIATRYPPPPPEPTVVVVQEEDGSADFGSHNFDPAKWAKKPRSWW